MVAKFIDKNNIFKEENSKAINCKVNVRILGKTGHGRKFLTAVNTQLLTTASDCGFRYLGVNQDTKCKSISN